MLYLLIIRIIRLSPCDTPAATDDMHIAGQTADCMGRRWGEAFGSESNVPCPHPFLETSLILYIPHNQRNTLAIIEELRTVDLSHHTRSGNAA